jgi:hypothetical protein
MKSKVFILTIVFFMSILLAANKYDVPERAAVRTARESDGPQLKAAPIKIGTPQYRPASRQGGILFVEDRGDPAFGPATTPDPLWDSTLTHIVGSGNFGWYGPTTTPAQNGPDLATMQGYDLVIWNCYDYWWAPPTYSTALTTTDQNNLASYMSGGGKVWLIGQDIIYSGVPSSWLQTHFNLQSYIEDYNYNIPNANIQGLVEIAGISLSVTSDYVSNYFFSDNLTPNANAHQVVLDVGYSAYPAIFNNDNTASFWTIDGRTPNPVASWEQMVTGMLDAFGVMGGGAFWDFEDGWQGWTHTNGGTFPAAWGVEIAALHGSLPDAGDSTMWIDSDAAGSGAGLIADTAKSPAVATPSGLSNYKWGIFHYGGGGSYLDEMDVGINYYASGAWTTVQLVHYATGTVTGPDWDSVDVSAFAGADSVQAWFYFTDLGTWGYYAAFDNVGFYPPPVHDVGATAILEPVGIHSINDVVTPRAQVSNFGDLDETFPVIFTMTLNAALVYADTVDITLAAGAVDTAVFNSYTFAQAGLYDVVSFTELAGDQNPANDTSDATVSIFEWVEDFETNNGGFASDPAAGAWEWGVPTSGPGAAHSGTQLWATILAGNYINYANWKLTSQGDYVATADNPHILFYHWYDIENVWDGGNVKYSTDNGASWILLHPVGGYDGVASTANSGIPAESCFTGTHTTWETEEIIIPVNTGQTFKLRFHFGTDGSVFYAGWYVDDLAGLGLTYVGIAEEPGAGHLAAFGFAPSLATVYRNHVPIAYSTTAPSHVSLKVYDNTGRLVRTLVDAQQPAGEKSVLWDNNDLNKRTVANGVYFLKLEAEGKTVVQKLILVR